MKKFNNLFILGFLMPVFLITVAGCGEKKQKPADPLNAAIKAVATNKTPENYINLSLRYYENRQYEKSLEAAQEALKLRPNYDLAYNNICASYNSMKNWDKGAEACLKGLSINPNNKMLKNNLEWALKGKAGK